MENAKIYAVPLGRLLMSSLFIWAGWEKLFKFGPAGTAGYFASKHIPIPDVAAWVVIIIELIGGLMLLVGFQTRWVALVLAIFFFFTGYGLDPPTGGAQRTNPFLQKLGRGAGRV